LRCFLSACQQAYPQALSADRITSFLHPRKTPKAPAISFAIQDCRGFRRFLGKGFRNGSQNQLGYIPVRYSDFIMSAWAEEQGFKGVLLALGLYMALLLRLVQNAQRAKRFARECFWSWASQRRLGLHVLVNVAMVIGAMPVTGIPLPLMSYGGSATLFVFLAIGLVMNVRLRRFVNDLAASARDVSAFAGTHRNRIRMGIADPVRPGSQARRILE